MAIRKNPGKIEIIYEMVSDKAIERLEKEKNSELSEATCRLIGLVERLHNSINAASFESLF